MHQRLGSPRRRWLLAPHAPMIALVVALSIFGCGGTSAPTNRTPPVGSLPDPAQIVSAEALAPLFSGATVSEPSCRYAESNYRCAWIDVANPQRALTVTIYSDVQRATQKLGGEGARAVAVPGAGQAAIIVGDAEIEAWAIVGDRGLQVTFAPDDGNPAAHEAALVALVSALAAAMSG